MSERHFYIGAENGALTNAERLSFVQWLFSQGRSDADAQPARRMHRRIRLDNDAVIFEAVFDDDSVDVPAIKARLAFILQTDVSNITHTTTTNSFGRVVTFRLSSVIQVRLIVFGGLSATWAQSRAATEAYLVANAAAWGDV